MKRIACLLALGCLAAFAPPTPTRAASILFYFGVSTYSHRNSVWPLVLSLANSGQHKVTFVNIYAPRKEHVHPNVTEFFPSAHSDPIFGDTVNIRLEGGRLASINVAARLPEHGYEVCRELLSSPDTEAWIARSKFDLVVVDAIFNECGYALAHLFGAKVIMFGPTTIFSWWPDAFGFPAETSWISDMIVPFQLPMSFGERVFTTLMPLIQYYILKYWQYYPKMDRLFAEKLNSTSMPSLYEMERDTALILTSTHYSEELARSLPPFVVSVGGMHMEIPLGQENAKQEVPDEILRWIGESGPDGFIYVSFGSSAAISSIPPEVQEKFFAAFRNSKRRILWKWEGDTRPEHMPSNVLTAKWMPQDSILNHPNLKAFVTHAGLMGLTEALTNGVPVIMFPIFAEQDYNAMRYEREQRGIRLEIISFTAAELQQALEEVVDNPKYKRNMETGKRLYADRPMSPLQTALWWTEYVLRHDRAELQRLKPLAMGQRWYERRLLDVWALLAALSSILLLTVFYCVKFVIRIIRAGKADSDNRKEKMS